MTKKDYDAIAKMLKSIMEDENIVTKSDVMVVTTHSLSSLFQLDNPRFNATKFKTACGYYTFTEKDAG
jgi:hypothetical protein